MMSDPRFHPAKIVLSLCLLGCLVASAARAQPTVDGVYNGAYTCAQGPTKLKLSLMRTAGGDILALFTFYLPPGTQNQPYTYSLGGQYDPHSAKLSLTP